MTENLDLKNHIAEVERYYSEGLNRIKNYYQGRKENPPLKDPPHEILEKVAAQFFQEAINVSNSRFNWQTYKETSLYEVCIGCGTEIFMKAIILLKNPEEFIKNLEISYEDCKNILMKILPPNLNSQQKERIFDVLRLIQVKRNKWAHLSFHKFSAYFEDYQIFNVLEYLYSMYFPNSEILKELRRFKEENKVKSGSDFESVEFK